MPDSSASLSLGTSSSRCSRTWSMLCPSGPAAPRFDATFSNASRSRFVTSSIVADGIGSLLCFDLGTARAAGTGRPVSAAPTDPRACAFGYSAGSKRSSSCPVRSLTGTAFPPPAGSSFRGATVFRRPCGTLRSSDFCRAIALRPFVLRATALAEPGRPPRVSVHRLHDHPVARTSAPPTDFGLVPLGAGSPDADASRRFAFARHGRAPTTSTRRSLAG